MKEIRGRYFLVGSPRSGTTFLQSFLNGHSDIASFPETHFFVLADIAWSKKWKSNIRGHKLLRDRLFEFLDEANSNHLKYLIPKFAISQLRYSKALVELLDQMTLAREKHYWVEKTPEHLWHIPKIKKHIPGARFIHIHRNGADVVASQYDARTKYPYMWGIRELDLCIARWNQDAHTTAEYLNQPNHYLIHYEALVTNPSTELGRLCEFIGVPFEPGMIKNRKVASKDIFLESEPWKQGVSEEKITNTTLRKFNQLFTKAEKKYILENLIKVENLDSG